MVEYMEAVLDEKGYTVSADDRNLFSVACKNLISSKRAACRTISAILQNPKYDNFSAQLSNYKQQIVNELIADCEKVIEMIEDKVLHKEGCEGEIRDFLVKMVGDYYRYIAEVA